MRVLGNWTMALLIGIAGIGLLTFVAAVAQWATWRSYLDSTPGSDAELDAYDSYSSAEAFHTAMSGIGVLAGLAAGIVFIVWLFRAARNTERSGAAGTMAAGWAIGAWFIPVANLFLPAIVVSQQMRAADPTLPRPVADAWRRVRNSGLVVGWWAALALAGIVGFAAGGIIPTDPDSIDGYEVAYSLYVVAAMLSCTAAILGTLVVRELTARQEQRILGAGGSAR